MEVEAESIDPDLIHSGREDADTVDTSPMQSESGEQRSPQSGSTRNESAAQKRRRVTRACDECRRKKIKCDGKQPCTHCTVYSYDCTYDQPSTRRRNPPPQFIEALEQKLARAHAVLHHFMPNLDLSDASLDAILQGDKTVSERQPSKFPVRPEKAPSRGMKTSSTPEPPTDPDLESMVHATGELDVDESGNWDYFGHSSNLFFLRRMRDHVGNLNGPEQSQDDTIDHRHPRKRSDGPPTIRDVGSPKSLLGQSMDSPFDNNHIGADELPSKELALMLCSAALDDACAVLNFVHHPSFYKSFDRIYAIRQDRYQDQDHKFLPLLYVILAVGCVFAKDEHSDLETKGYKSATGIGYKYFWAARQLLDITDCRDITSLQAIVFMIMFLQSSAKLATCYAYIGVALRSAMRMGLHRSFRDSFTPVEAECRKRVFWTIRKMDIYVGAILGLPQTLSEDEIDQDYPTEVADEAITDQGIVSMPHGDILPPLVAANANFRLCSVLTKIVKTIYPIKGFSGSEENPSRCYSVSYAAIKDIESDLQRWKDQLPPQLVPHDKPSENADKDSIRMQQLLRLGYAHAQLLLYRPFLHYVSSKHQITSVSQRSYACAAACVTVSRNIIHITSEMRRQGLLQGSYWFSMYSTFFGILSLVFFALENPQSATENDIVKDAFEGKETLSRLAKRSMAADRCTLTLDVLFEQLGPTLEKRKKAAANHPVRKREASLSHVNADGSLPRAQASHGAAETIGKGRAQKARKAATGPRTGQNTRQPTKPERASTQPHARPSQRAGNFGQNPVVNSPLATSSSSSFSTPLLRHAQESYDHHQQQAARQHIPTQQQSQQHMSFLPSQEQGVQHPNTLSDMEAVMFPSDNPFAYPRQPMNTLEQRYAYEANHHGNTQQFLGPGQDMYLNASTFGTETVAADDNLDVQLFGPLPPYMHGQGSNMDDSPWGQALEGSFENPPQINSNMNDMWNQQARSAGLPGMNLDDLFAGDEWQGGNDGYRNDYRNQYKNNG